MRKRHNRYNLPSVIEPLESRSLLAADPSIVAAEWGPQPLQHVVAEFWLTVSGQTVRFGDTPFAQQWRNTQQAESQINRNALNATRQTYGLDALGTAVIQNGLLLTSSVVIPAQPPEPGQNTSPSFPPLATGQPVPQDTGDPAQAVADSLRALTRYAVAFSLTVFDDPDVKDDEHVTRVVPLANGTVGQITICIPNNIIIVSVTHWAGQAGTAALDQMSDFWLDELDTY